MNNEQINTILREIGKGVTLVEKSPRAPQFKVVRKAGRGHYSVRAASSSYSNIRRLVRQGLPAV